VATILLFSTADTELLAARAADAGYRTANPARIPADDPATFRARLASLTDGADLVVLRLLGGRQAWPEGVAALRATGLPLVIHTRDADDDCQRILEEEIGRGPFRAVLHCYTGGRELAMRAIELGLSISFTGILTFKKSDALRALAAELPADRIMVETDAPYLAPGKFRGKRNEPAYVVEVARVLAEARGVTLEEISRQTTENFFRFFSKVPASVAA